MILPFLRGSLWLKTLLLSRFVETIQKAVRNASFNHNLTEKLSKKEPYMSDLDVIYCMTALLSFDLFCLLCVS